MKFATAIVAAASLVGSVLSAALDTRQTPVTYPFNNNDCIGFRGYYGYHESCANLHSTCGKQAGERPELWSNPVCVAAATCSPPSWAVLFGRCALTSRPDGSFTETFVAPQSQQASLNYNVYASIVGDCAWGPEGCPITQQNYVDFYYGALTTNGATVWPTYEQVLAQWNNIKTWANTGETVPYTNFNDYLHWASR